MPRDGVPAIRSERQDSVSRRGFQPQRAYHAAVRHFPPRDHAVGRSRATFSAVLQEGAVDRLGALGKGDIPELTTALEVDEPEERRSDCEGDLI